MKIKFDEFKEQVWPHFKNGNLEMKSQGYVDENARIALGTLIKGASIGEHTHTDSCEIIYVLSGTGTAITKDGKEVIHQGECHYCPKGQMHSFINEGEEDLKVLTIVIKQ